jgi:hypothetical protein
MVIYFLVFDFMQDTIAIRSNDNLDCVEHARLCRREIYSMLCCLNSLHYINKEKTFKTIGNAPWNFYVKLTARHTRLLINLWFDNIY